MHEYVNKCVFLAAAIGCCGTLAQEHEGSGASRPIEFESDSFSLDRSTNVMTFKGFRIDTGDWNLRADEAGALATDLDFVAGQWHFSGNVRIEIGTARITAERATFLFENQGLVRGELEGSPVVFEETAPSREGPVLGRAELIRYDNIARTVELLGKVGLSVGPYDTTGCDLVYYLDEEDFTTGSAQCEEPFTVIITPNEEPTSEPRVDGAP